MVAQTQKLIIMKKIRRITIDYFCCSINDIDASIGWGDYRKIERKI